MCLQMDRKCPQVHSPTFLCTTLQFSLFSLVGNCNESSYDHHRQNRQNQLNSSNDSRAKLFQNGLYTLDGEKLTWVEKVKKSWLFSAKHGSACEYFSSQEYFCWNGISISRRRNTKCRHAQGFAATWSPRFLKRTNAPLKSFHAIQTLLWGICNNLTIYPKYELFPSQVF